jgi:hypothetical protein
MPIRIERNAEPIPGYKLIERLGGGGFGEVWKTAAPGGLQKAIKFVYGDLQTAGDEGIRVEQELKALSRVKDVRHPYILSLERIDILEGQLMIVMELADRNLWDRFKECQGQGLTGIPRDELLRYMEESAEALDLMNQQYQLQHLDIKPQNIFLVHNHIKVADFGLVKDLQGIATRVTGGVTPVYASPETFDGWVSRFCDQYSLAIVYQELLTGKRPFAANNVHQLIMQHVNGKPDLEALPPEDRESIARALSKKPDDRHQCCMDLVRGLRPRKASGRVAPGSTAGVDRPAEQQGDKAGAVLERELPRTPPSRPKAKAAPESIQPETITAQEAAALAAPFAETRGDGELFPALIIGLGGMGLLALQSFRRELEEKFGSRETLPHLRLLYLDTLPDAPQVAVNPETPGALSMHEVLHTRLNRASHFLKPRDGRPPFESWFSHNLLYRIQRNLETGGLRPLGRLAFFDNYRPIVQRLRLCLEGCLNQEHLTQAMRQTGLGLRTNRPRVYVVSSLSGGTGGGMFIDMAYVVRDQLRALGHESADIVGLFILPPVDAKAANKIGLGNTFASLTELNHFSSGGGIFSARYDDRERPVQDSRSPFSRCVFVSQPPAKTGGADVANLIGAFLAEDLTSPLGRNADTRRSEQQTSQTPQKMVGGQTFGIYRISWPRRTILQQASRRFCRSLAQRWIAKDARPVQEAVKAIIQEQWAAQELGAECLISRLRMACERFLGQAPEGSFAALTDPIVQKSGRPTDIDPAELLGAMAQVEQLIGIPSESAVLSRAGALEEVIQSEAEALGKEWEQKISRFTVGLIEKPEFRLAGAEEAIRLAGALIDQGISNHEPLLHELSEKAGRGYDRLVFLVANFADIAKGGRRGAPLVTELNELLRLYPKWRYQNIILKRVHLTLNTLRGFLSDQLREQHEHRSRLTELLRYFEGFPATEVTDENRHGSHILPQDCITIDDAVNHLFPDMAPSQLEELDVRMQEIIGNHFTSFTNICSASSSQLRNLEISLVEEVIKLIESRLIQSNVVDLFLQRYANETAALDALSQAFESAAPKLAGFEQSGQSDFAIMVAPDGAQMKALKALTARAIPSCQIVQSSNGETISLYREEVHCGLPNLEHAGPAGEDAYLQMASSDVFPPHCRSDIRWRGLT